MTEPLTPSDCNLREFPFMPLQVNRLRASKAWLKAKRKPALGFYMINLWTASWYELPAASLEDDDDMLADKAMCSPTAWPGLREEVLHGWIKCADGRLYHPTVAEAALEAWKGKQEHKAKKDHDTERKRIEREERANLFADMRAAGYVPPWDCRTSELRKAVQDLSDGHPPDILGMSRLRKGQGKGKGDGQGKGEGEGLKNPSGSSAGKPRRARKCPDSFTVTAEMVLWATADVPGVNIEIETAKFRDHEFDKPKSSWEGTWRNWMRRAQALGGVSPIQPSGPTTTISAAGAQTLRNAAAAEDRIFGPRDAE